MEEKGEIEEERAVRRRDSVGGPRRVKGRNGLSGDLDGAQVDTRHDRNPKE